MVFQNLQILKLIGFVDGFYGSLVSNIGLTILAQGCKRLAKLELNGCEESYDGIKAIGQCYQMLEELTLINHKMDGGWLSALSYCENLKTLKFQSSSTPNACDFEDNDYDPDGSEVDKKVEGDESSSDESDFYSFSEDNGDSPKNKQKLELPYSDDLEDDDYDPDAPDLSDQVKQESSSSDFTSDSEDFSVAFNDNIYLHAKTNLCLMN
ncbi:F-box protein [Camellia lanceoleosa]|uniref:F-box protein n=1 Tax=Camellia lanceoleosa TaxID=1840588 RepID=A0ACC0F4W1_9ERIC|nr:F-box protein [Camellia lanceoleosa]